MTSAASLYHSVINDVVNSVRDSFLDEAVDGDPVAVAVDRAQGLTGISHGGLLRTRTTARGATAEAIRFGLEEDLSHFAVGDG